MTSSRCSRAKRIHWIRRIYFERLRSFDGESFMRRAEPYLFPRDTPLTYGNIGILDRRTFISTDLAFLWRDELSNIYGIRAVVNKSSITLLYPDELERAQYMTRSHIQWVKDQMKKDRL